MEKFSAGLKGWLTPAKRFSAMHRLERMKAAPKPKKVPGDFEHFKGKALRTAGWGLLGAGSTVAGIHHITKREEPQYQSSPHSGGEGAM